MYRLRLSPILAACLLSLCGCTTPIEHNVSVKLSTNGRSEVVRVTSTPIDDIYVQNGEIPPDLMASPEVEEYKSQGISFSESTPHFGDGRESARLTAGNTCAPKLGMDRGICPDSAPSSLRRGYPERGTMYWWNFWMESHEDKNSAKPNFKALDSVSPRSRATLFLDLAGVKYHGPNIISNILPKGLAESIENLLKDTARASADVTVLLMPDPKFFQITGDNSRELKIDLDRIRKWSGRSQGESWKRRARESSPEFLFGSTSFEIETLSAPGVAWLGLSFWSHGRPLGEFPVPVCIASPEQANDLCYGNTVNNTRVDGDLVRIASEEAGVPDASLHFVQLPNWASGVFWCQACPQPGYHVWTMARPLGEIGDLVQRQILNNVGGLRKSDDLRLSGKVLFKNLFPPFPPRSERNPVEERRREATLAFARFLEDRLNKKSANYKPLSKIFVRFSVQPSVADSRLPLGLVYAGDVFNQASIKKLQPGVEGDVFLGFRFLIEAPLPTQSFADTRNCIKKWYLAVPAPVVDADLKLAAGQLKGSILAWQVHEKIQKVFPDMRQFGDWLIDGEEADGSALMILSHHDAEKRRIYYVQDETGVVAAGIQRNFVKPSLVILDGCKTGYAGMGTFPDAFNEKGFSTAIVTAMNADPYLAGDFMDCLADEVSKAGVAGRPVSEIFFSAQTCLSNRNPPGDSTHYGPNALAFYLLGNDNLRLCSPEREARR